MIREKTALFIGHSDCFGVSEQDVKDEVIRLIRLGVTDFLSGGQGGFDRLCARCVYELQSHFPEIKNILVIPYLSFTVFNPDIFDEIVYPDGFEQYHFKAAIGKRNRYMVDHAAFAICWVNHGWGGAVQTYERAVKQQLQIVNLGRYFPL